MDYAKNAAVLDHNSFMTMAIGNVQTLSVTAVLPGDQLSLDSLIQFKLSPLHRSLSVDGIIDVIAFYEPHRRVYANWVDYMKEGYDETETLASFAHNNPVVGCSCLGLNMVNGVSYPLWQLTPYIHFWNRYIKHPTVTPDIEDDYVPGEASAPVGHTSANSIILGNDVAMGKYGLPAAHLKDPKTTGIISDIQAADKEIDMTATHTLDILELNKKVGRYGSEQERSRFYQRYTDLMQKWGSSVTTDADPRPRLIERKTYSLSGRDIVGMGDANFGDSTGKAMGDKRFGFDRTFFPEHGSLWIVAVLRFPPIMYNEANPLSLNTNPDYTRMSGEYDLVKREEPYDEVMSQWATDAGATSIGNIPYGEWYRHHQNHVHSDYAAAPGFPFMATGDMSTHPHALYVRQDRYDGMFSSRQLKHCTAQSYFRLRGTRIYPTARDSIFAGTNR